MNYQYNLYHWTAITMHTLIPLLFFSLALVYSFSSLLFVSHLLSFSSFVLYSFFSSLLFKLPLFTLLLQFHHIVVSQLWQLIPIPIRHLTTQHITTKHKAVIESHEITSIDMIFNYMIASDVTVYFIITSHCRHGQ